MSNLSYSTVTIDRWFIPLDILMIACTVTAVLLSLLFLLVIISDKTCHTTLMLLIGNSCLAEFIFGSDMLAMAIFTFRNDYQRIPHEDSLCILRGFIGYVVTILQNYSYLLQAIYRYGIIVHPSQLFYQSARFQLFLICSTWMFGFLCPIPYILTNEIQYNIENQICQMPLRLSFLAIYNALCVYTIPISLTVFVYFKLVRYVHQMSKQVTPVNTLLRAQRELKMVLQVVLLLLGLATIGFPYALFVVWGCFANLPKYHFRIAYIFVDVSLVFVMIALYEFTDALKSSLLRRIRGRTNVLIPAVN